MTIGLSGQSFTASQGTAKAPNETANHLVYQLTFSQGTAQGISSQEATLTGQSFSASL